MEDFRKKCLDRNYKGECPIDGRPCAELDECPQGEKEILRNYAERMKGQTEVSKSKFGKAPYKRYPDTDWEKLPTEFLKFLLKPKCCTDPRNKEIAKKVLAERRVCDKQLELEVLKK